MIQRAKKEVLAIFSGLVDWFESQEVKNSKTLNVKKSTSRSEKSRGQEVEAFKSRRPKLTDVETLGFRPRLQC